MFSPVRARQKFCTVEHWRRAATRAQNSARRARRKALPFEWVDPLDILVRDAWTCRLCGREAPAGLRGTYHKDAPEIDHIVPLAKGGHHVRGNLQCAHRACNLKKGAASAEAAA